MEANTNFDATAAHYGIDGFGLLRREKLRIRIMRDHAAWADAEPVVISPGRLPQYETGIEQVVFYEGDGRIPEDILGAPRP